MLLAAVRAEDNRPLLRLATHATFAPHIVPQVLDALAPLQLEIDCADAHSEDIVRLIDDGAVDIGLVVPCPHAGSMTLEPFLDDPVICVAEAAHPLTSRPSLRVRDLAAYLIAWNAWGQGADQFRVLLQPAQLPSHRLQRVSPAETVASLARRGTHVGVVSRSTVERDLGDGTLAQLPVTDLPHWQITLCLAYRNEDADTRAVRAVRSAVSNRRGD